MMRILLIVGGLLICTQTFAQSKVVVGLMVSPSIEQTIATHRLSSYNSRFSMNYGLKGKVTLTRQITLNTGLNLLDKGSVVPVTIETDLFHHALYLSIPITVQYTIPITNRLSIGPSIGLTYGRRVYEYFKQRTRDRIWYIVDTWHVNPHYFGGLVGLETNFMISKRWSLSIAPYYNRQLNDLWRGSAITQERFDSFIVEMTGWYRLR